MLIPDAASPAPSSHFASLLDDLIERHIARLVIVLYEFGQPLTGLFDGETREIESRTRLGRLDFWMREPGHLALALLRAVEARSIVDEAGIAQVRSAIIRMVSDDLADRRRVALPGASYKPYNISGDLDHGLAFLLSRSIASDRPSFDKTGPHRIVLETPGIALARQIYEQCPAFGWYREQAAAIRAFMPILDSLDLALMDYLGPGLSPVAASSVPLAPYIKARHDTAFA